MPIHEQMRGPIQSSKKPLLSVSLPHPALDPNINTADLTSENRLLFGDKFCFLIFSIIQIQGGQIFMPQSIYVIGKLEQSGICQNAVLKNKDESTEHYC